MATKLYIILLAISVSNVGFGQGIEVQRKYGTSAPEELKKFIIESGQTESFKTFNHSEYTYFDLYLDTPDFILLKQGFSLRLRKKIQSDSLLFYVFQIKSEMNSTLGFRMEVEEPELNFYKLWFNDEETNLADLLNLLFEDLEAGKRPQSKQMPAIFESLQKWISLKAGAPIAPFQKLKRILPDFQSETMIATLEPKIIGKSQRIRSHVYLSKEKGAAITATEIYNSQRGDNRPQFFLDHPDQVWVLEASYDLSTFYPLFNSTIAENDLVEFEVENKYFSDSLGVILMDKFELEMKDNYKLASLLDSKYSQNIKAFNGDD